MNTTLWTMASIKQANKEAGLHFFEKATMEFFRSRIDSRVYQGPGGVYFVTAETDPGNRERWTVREFIPSTGVVETVGKFHWYSTPQDARTEARLLSMGLVEK